MSIPKISEETFDFLKLLSKNNQRDWFNENKILYQNSLENMHACIDYLIIQMNKHDELDNISGKKALYRIYNDVRFSKDKSPYNPRFAFRMSRATKLKRGGYYVNIKPDNSYLACGFFAPNSADLLRIREDINYNYEQWNEVLHGELLKANFGEITGSKVLSAPRGFNKNHEAIHLLRHKQFFLKHNFMDSEITANDFLSKVNEIFRSVRPFFDYMSEVLTTNGNGELTV